jgi:hypothetical protein
VKEKTPLANTEAMITRPLSTMAIQTAGSSLRKAAAKRSQAKGAALPGQSVPTAKAKVNGAAGGATKASSTVNGAVRAPTVRQTSASKVPPSKAVSVNRA